MKFKRKLTMKIFKLFTIVLFIIFSSLTSITYAESLKFDASTYEGEVKKGKAHGVGIFTFLDGSTYEGKVKKNKIHGKGKYTDAQGKVYEGKFRYGSFITKIDIEGFENELFSKNTDWIKDFYLITLEIHDWMMPKQSPSKNFFREHSKENRDCYLKGDMVFSIKN